MYILKCAFEILVKIAVTLAVLFCGMLLFLSGFYGLGMYIALGEFFIKFTLLLVAGAAVMLLGLLLSVVFTDDYA